MDKQKPTKISESKATQPDAVGFEQEATSPVPPAVPDDAKSTGSKHSSDREHSKSRKEIAGHRKSPAVGRKKSLHGNLPSKPGRKRQFDGKEHSAMSTKPNPEEEDNDDDDPEMRQIMEEDEEIPASSEEEYKFIQAFADLERLGEEEDMLSTVSSETGEYVSEEYMGEEEGGEFPEDELEIHEDDLKRRRRRTTRIDGKAGAKDADEEIGEESDEWVDPEYYREDFISMPLTSSPDAGFNEAILRLYHSYGFDTQRPFNIQCLDAEHVIYICGNYLHFYNIPLQKVIFLHRSASGLGLGHVAVHPSRKYFAIGEKGDKPFIMIYTWPDLKVFRVLRKGTLKGFAYLDFNSTGELLCSQGMGPDYMLTIWDWFHEKILMRQKGTQEVYRANFSPSTPGDITTSGLEFIQFWKMTEVTTATGTTPKLVEQLGNFGEHPYDIFGFTGIGDGKVVSGSPNGNLDIWDNGSIVVEITQKEGKKCHGAQIMDIKHQDSEMLTIGRDGFVRTWETELLELAALSVDPEIGKVQVEPLLELNLGSIFQPVSATRVPLEPADRKTWLIQDTWGKVWNIDISAAMASSEYSPSTLFFAPGGAIKGIGMSTRFSVMVAGTAAGHLWAFDYISKVVIARKVYITPVSKILWIPTKYDSSGQTFLVGFDDGTVRLMMLTTIDTSRVISEVETGLSHEMFLLQSLKFHKGQVLVLKIDEDANILYTTGADRVIFGSRILWDENLNKPVITPLSFVTSPFPVTSLDLHPSKNYRFIIAGRGGRVAECRRPIWEEIDSIISYNKGKLHGKRWFYKSVKSARLHEEDHQQRRRNKQQELEALRQNINERKEAGAIVAEELEISRVVERYRRQQEKEDEKEFPMPESPCPLLSVYYHVNPRIGGSSAGQTFFLHVDGFDAGYIYECKYNRPEAGGFHKVPPTPPFGLDIGINCFLVSNDDMYLLFGMIDGSIRVMPRAHEPIRPFHGQESILQSTGTGSGSSSDDDVFNPIVADRKKSRKTIAIAPAFPVSHYPYDLQKFWTLPMHDPDRGPVVELAWSFDNEFLVSIGEDGAIFVYRWDPAGKLHSAEEHLPTPLVPETRYEGPALDDTENVNALTLEELKAKAETDRIFELTEGTKEIIRRQLRKLKVDYRAIVQKNDEVPFLFRVPRSKFELDPRIKEPRQTRFQKEIEQVFRRYEWDGSRSVIACDKIQKHFLDTIETHHKNVKDLEHTVEAHTFRHRFLTPEFWEVFQNNQDTLANEKSIEDEVISSENKKVEVVQVIEPMRRFYAKDMIGEYAGKKYDVKTKHAIRQLEERLLRRYIRECEWAELNALKVPDNYEADEDVEAIKYAMEHTGDYKLKSGEEFLVGDKTTAAERRKKILDLKIMIYETVQEYNEHLKILEDEKVSVIEYCRKLEYEIRESHKNLPMEQRVPIPLVYDIIPAENPEAVFTISQKDVSQLQNQKLEAAGLLKRKKIAYGEETEELSMPITPVEEKVKPKRQKVRKPGDFVRNRNDPRAPKVVLKKLEQAFSMQISSGPMMKTFVKRKDLEGLSIAVFRYRKAFFNPKTEAAQRRRDRVLARRSFERDFVLKRLRQRIDYFKQRVIQVRNERIELQLDVKLMTIALLAFIQELDVVKDFETAENDVLERYESQKLELEISKRHVEKSRRHLNHGKRDLRKVEDFLTKLAKEVSALVYEQGRYSEYLWKVFRKRIRLGTADEEEGGESNSEDSSNEGSGNSSKSSGASSSSSDSYADLFKPRLTKYNINVCPDDLDQEVYNKICDLRQKKAFLDADLSAQKEVVGRLTEEFNESSLQYTEFQARMGGLQNEIDSLQRERQMLINNLRKLVIIKASQVQCIDEDKLETDNGPILERIKRNFPNIEDVIVFPKDGTLKLDQRLDELKDEIRRQKRKQQRARYMLVRLREELHKKEDHVAKLLEDCRKDMVGRFGRVVDMEDLCAGSINLEILDIMEELEVRRKKHYAERDQLNKRIQQARHDLTAVTTANSELNIMLAMLEERQRDVDYFLYQQQKAEPPQRSSTNDVSKDHRGSGDSEASNKSWTNEDVIEEMYSLEDRLINQEAKIVYLRETIASCKIKGRIPEIAMMTSIPDNVASKFMTYRELQEYKSYLNKEVETLYSKNNTEQLLQSTSVMPSFDVSRAVYKEKDRPSKPEGIGGQEQEILNKLDDITNPNNGDELETEGGAENEMESSIVEEGDEGNDSEKLNSLNVELPNITPELVEEEE